jgi:CBS domain-containing protein
MTSHNGQQRVPCLPLRNRRTLGADGEEVIAATLYCPVRERSVGVVECESCDRFHALEFERHVTSVMCHCETAAPTPAEEAVLRDALGGPPDPQTPLADIMSKEVVCVRFDMDVQKVKDLLIERGFSGVPVVDDRGRAIGVVSRADVMRFEWDQDITTETEMEPVTVKPSSSDEIGLIPDHEPAHVTAGDIMSTVVIALPENANIGQAASLMAFEGIHRLPIVSDEGEVVGILSSLDVLRWFGRRCGYVIPQRRERK